MYINFIGKFCGNKFPPIITSSGRSLWLRFTSDNTIEYQGFKIVYTSIPNPEGPMPDMGKCKFDIGGSQDFFGTANISEARIANSKDYSVPIDCVWTIQVDENYQVYIKFNEPKLSFPNDCYLNYLQVTFEKI